MEVVKKQEYLKLLGLSESCTVADIKREYRAKAKELHPDRNSAENAEELFIELNEAYEYLIAWKTGKLNVKTKQSQARNEYAEREAARARARAYAQMKYEEFKKTDRYKDLHALYTVTDFFTVGLSLFILIGGPIIGAIESGWSGLFISGIIILVLTPFWANEIVNVLPNLQFSILDDSIIRLVRTDKFKILAVVLLNLILLAIFTLSTLISAYTILALYVGAVALGFLISYFFLDVFYRNFLAFGIAPLLINLFFCFNFLMSDEAVTEQHHYQLYQEYHRGRTKQTSLLLLDDNAYEEYLFIRYFFNYEEVRKYNNITYSFANGCFGLRVMKDYELH